MSPTPIRYRSILWLGVCFGFIGCGHTRYTMYPQPAGVRYFHPADCWIAAPPVVQCHWPQASASQLSSARPAAANPNP